MSQGDIEVLFYNLNNAVLLGNSGSAKMYLSMLREEYDKDPQSFDFLTNDNRWNELRQLGNAVDNGLIVKNFNYKDNANTVDKANEEETRIEDERKLVKIICQQYISTLKDILKTTDSLYLYNVEQPTQYGRVDIVLQDNDVVYLIEVKKGDARYSVISQIDKYLMDYNLKLIYKFWKKVIGVTIAGSYIGGVSRELIKFGVIPIKYKVNDDGTLKFRRLYGEKEENNNP